MKKTMKKIVALGSGAVLLVSASVMGTMAYLTSTTDVVNNTFTVGKVGIDLTEAKVNEYGVEDTGAERVKANTYKLIPGHSYTKDPTVYVNDDSEDCWLFVKVENGLAQIEVDANDGDTILEQMSTNGWTLVPGQTNVYAYNEIVQKNENVKVFGSFALDGNADVASYKNAAITITAYAVQADGFTTSALAWNGAPASWN